MSLYQSIERTLHSGGSSGGFLIDCKVLSDESIEALAQQIAKRVSPFAVVVGIPRGGLRIATALLSHCDPLSTRVLIVDDVLTTGASMESRRLNFIDPIGAVIYARGLCPGWIMPLFTLAPLKENT